MKTYEPTREEKGHLAALWQDGAWTVNEYLQCPTIEQLHEAGLVTQVPTDIGPLVVLRHAGMRVITNDSLTSVSPQVALDRAYLRLSLAHLGWPVITDGLRGRYQDSMKLDRYTLVRTDRGLAYVIARLNARGMSSAGMRKALAGLRGTLAYNRQQLVVITPSAVRGRTVEAREGGVLRVVRLRLHTAKRSDRRLNTPTFGGGLWGDTHKGPGPILTPDDWQGLALRGTPARTLELLSLDRAARIEEALSALQVDRVLSGAQLGRHYGLTPQDMTGVPFVEDLIVPVYKQPDTDVHTRFYLANRKLASREGLQLAHLAGAAEMRHQLNVPARSWNAGIRESRKGQVPDAIWTHPGGVTAVEYDSGSYSMRTVTRKVDTFLAGGYSDVIWGLPSPRRAKRLGQMDGVRTCLVHWYVH